MQTPVLFVGHGNPMNALEDNRWTRKWQALRPRLGEPEAILAISAHWWKTATWIQSAAVPNQIYDMYGFPEALYQISYPAAGSPSLTQGVLQALGDRVSVNDTWGIDHGTWSVLVHLFPGAPLPVVQLSVNRSLDSSAQMELGQLLVPLREQNILILCSGNIVHNLRAADWHTSGGTSAADGFDQRMRDAILAGDTERVLRWADDPAAGYAVPQTDHLAPLFYALGAAGEDRAEVFNDERTMAALSMTGYLFGG